MNQFLPYSGFKWLNQKEIDKFCLNSLSKSISDGYVLEKLFKNILMNYMNCMMIIL